jgi:DNA-binding MarR family transcriptional regulator
MPPETKRDQFARLLVSIGHAVTRLEREQVCCGDLSFQQFDTLRRIDRDGTNTVSALSSVLAIDESTASRNVGILVRDGYLKKERDHNDGRTFQLRLTTKARLALSTLSCDERDVFGAAFERLPPGDRRTSLAVLAALERALNGDQRQSCCAPGTTVPVTGRGQRA